MGNEGSSLLKKHHVLRFTKSSVPMYSKNRRTSSQTTRQKQKEVIKRSPTSDTPSETSSIVQTTVTPPIFNETSTTLGSVPVTPSTSGNRLLTPQPARPRSRSLCAQQIEADVQTVNANSPLLSPQVNRENGRETRKHSTGVVPSLNRIRITSAFKIAKSSMGEAILKRASASRPEIRLFLVKLNEEQMSELGRVLFEMIGEGVARLDSADHVQNAGKSAGAAFAVLSPMGFRPDFFAPLADAAIAECVKLDAGSHKRCETLLAWSQLVSALFSAVRDGYYSRIRYQRRSSLPQGQLQIQRVPSLDLCKNAISESP